MLLHLIKLLLWIITILKLTSAAVIPNKEESSIFRAVISQKQNSLFKRDGNLYSDDPFSYYINIDIGIPSQSIKVVLDTGSSDLVMPTTACPKEHCSEFTPFDPEKSSTFQKDGRPMKRMYGSGEASGYFGTETISIGDSTINNFTVAFATDTTNLPSGILGLGYPALTQYVYNPFPIQLYQDQKIKQGMFSIYFDTKSSDKNNKGEIIFGGSNKSKYIGNLISISNPPTKTLTREVYAYWDVTGQSTRVLGRDGKVLQTSDPKSKNGDQLVVDTGTSLTMLPQSSVDIIVSIFKSGHIQTAEGMYVVSCSQPYYSDYSVQFTVGSPDKPINLNVPLQDMIVQVESDGPKPTCVLGVVPSDDLFILGLSVIHNFYMEFDFVQHQVSFATVSGSNATITM